MSPDTRPWDDCYRGKRAPEEPSKLLRDFSWLLPARGIALDVACGGGRNSVFLAERGLHVVAVDLSWEALRQGGELARRRKVSIDWIQADLENFLLPSAAFDLILCFSYRDPGLYPALRATLRPGGLLFYATFTQEQLRFPEGPRNVAHLLECGEMLNAFGDWELIFYRERWIRRGVASLIARKPAAWTGNRDYGLEPS